MRLPFNLSNSELEEGARVKFIYTSPELNQNIEISLDGDETSVEALIAAFERFLSALGIVIPSNCGLAIVEMDEESEEDEEDEEKK